MLVVSCAISTTTAPKMMTAGLPMRAYWPLSIVEHGLGLNITVISYAGSLDFGITVARNAVPDAHRIAGALLERLRIGSLIAGRTLFGQGRRWPGPAAIRSRRARG